MAINNNSMEGMLTDKLRRIGAAHELYNIVKELLIPFEKKGSLTAVLNQDIINLAAFLALLSGKADNLAAVVADGICGFSEAENTTEKLREAMENLGISDLLVSKTVTPETEKALSRFTESKNGILSALGAFGDSPERSMLSYMYASLITAAGQLMERQENTQQFLTGWNNYLRTQYYETGEHLGDEEAVQFRISLMPYLNHINREMKKQ